MTMRNSKDISVIVIFAIANAFLINLASSNECTLECYRGVCEMGQADFSAFNKYNTAHNLPFASITHVDMMHCECAEGYTGVTCNIKYDSCNNNAHACFNGAKCVQVASAIGALQYRCDCTAIDDDNVAYAGLYCEHSATINCAFGTSVSKNSFCTNDGSCVPSTDIGQAHQGCVCIEGYSGQHCEYSLAHSKAIASNSNVNSTIQNKSTASTNELSVITSNSNISNTIQNKSTASTNELGVITSNSNISNTIQNKSTASTNELGATIIFYSVVLLCTVILIFIIIVGRQIKKSDDPFLSSSDKTIQHATTSQMNTIDDDLHLEQDTDEVNIFKENEII